ncbi:MAG: coenzyme F420-0:L-glutamate ligase [Candidatus Lokiarchaeota archaeon]|nr:coenzyme F420-0:L-glutamate ligase [Candidatus Lokiarchaeota archaeon]
MKPISIFPLEGIPLVKKNDNIVEFLLKAVKDTNINGFQNDDILIISHTLICKIYGFVSNIKNIKPNRIAQEITNIINRDRSSKQDRIDPRHIQLILNHSTQILRYTPYLITRSKQGFVCAHSGIDKSNIKGKDNYIYLPDTLDEIAHQIRKKISELSGANISIIISDSQSRPFRKGSIGVAVGIAGITSMIDFRGNKDLYGYELKHSMVNHVDELCSAGQLLMGESNEAVPAVIVRNYNFRNHKNIEKNDDIDIQNQSINKAIRPKQDDLFRYLTPEDFLRGRRSFKGQFLDRSVTDGLVEKVFKIVKFSPSAHNRQPWEYFWIRNPKTKEKLITEMGNKWSHDLQIDGRAKSQIEQMVKKSIETFNSAPVFIIVTLDKSKLDVYSDHKRNKYERILGIQSVAASIMYLLLSFRHNELEACWYSAGLFAQDVISIILKLPDKLEPQAIVIAGYAERIIGEFILPRKTSKREVNNFLHII